MTMLFHTSVQSKINDTKLQDNYNSSATNVKNKRIVLNKCCENYEAFDIISKRCFELQNNTNNSTFQNNKTLLLGK